MGASKAAAASCKGWLPAPGWTGSSGSCACGMHKRKQGNYLQHYGARVPGTSDKHGAQVGFMHRMLKMDMPLEDSA